MPFPRLAAEALLAPVELIVRRTEEHILGYRVLMVLIAGEYDYLLPGIHR